MALSSVDIGIISVVIILTIIGLILYLAVLPALIKVNRDNRQPFYILMISLALPEILWLILTLIYSVPTMILGSVLFGPSVERAMGNFDTIVYFMQLTHLFFISVNRLRFVARSSTETFDKAFTSGRIIMWCTVLWAFSIGIVRVLYLLYLSL